MDYEESIFDIETIRSYVRKGCVVWRDHAMKRLRERKITRDDVRSAIYNEEIVEDRPDGIPTPCCLILGSNIIRKIPSCDLQGVRRYGLHYFRLLS